MSENSPLNLFLAVFVAIVFGWLVVRLIEYGATEFDVVFDVERPFSADPQADKLDSADEAVDALADEADCTQEEAVAGECALHDSSVLGD